MGSCITKVINLIDRVFIRPYICTVWWRKLHEKTNIKNGYTKCKKLQSKVANICGRSGIGGNEKSDELYRAESDHSCIGPEPAIGISSAITRSLIWYQVKNKHITQTGGI